MRHQSVARSYRCLPRRFANESSVQTIFITPAVRGALRYRAPKRPPWVVLIDCHCTGDGRPKPDIPEHGHMDGSVIATVFLSQGRVAPLEGFDELHVRDRRTELMIDLLEIIEPVI